MIGIYQIANAITDQVYVGQSVNIEKRWAEHKCRLRAGGHENDFLQKSWNKYGEKSFSFSLLEECEKEVLLYKEQSWVLAKKSMKKDGGFNLVFPEEAQSPTEETRVKISQSLKGRPSPMKGRSQSNEAKAKVTKSLIGNTRRKGIPHTGETKSKMSQTRRKLTDEQVLDIYFRSNTGEDRHLLAEEFGIKPQMVSRIKHKKEFYENIIDELLAEYYPEMKALAPVMTGLVRCELRPDRKDIRVIV